MKLSLFISILFVVFIVSCKTTSSDSDITRSSRCRLESEPHIDTATTKMEIIRVMDSLGWPKKDGINFIMKEDDSDLYINYKNQDKKQDYHLITHDYYITNLECSKKTPDWVIHLVHSNKTEKHYCRVGSFPIEPAIKDHEIENCTHKATSYVKSGFQKGHLAPAMDFSAYSKKAVRESNFTSNIAPQIGVGFNEHLWKRLEAVVREWAKKEGDLLILTGTISLPTDHQKNLRFFVGPGEGTSQRTQITVKHRKPQERASEFIEYTTTGLGEHQIQIPDYYYKVVVNIKEKTYQAFLIKNTDHREVKYQKNQIICLDKNGEELPSSQCPENDNLVNIKRHMVSLDDLEKLTGYDFFPSEKLKEDQKPKIWHYDELDRYKQKGSQ